VSLASVLLRTSELKAQARPVVRDLADRQGLAVSLAAWDRGQVIYIDRRASRCQGPGPLPGTSRPLDGSAIAQVLLASRPAAEVHTLWRGGLVHTRHASVDELEQDLGRIRLHGWAQNDTGEGGCAVAAPVKDIDGSVAAAIGLDLARSSLTANVDLHARAVQAAASRITAAIREHAVAA
jgi:IclR family transcriptional regulator, KDG regulon repressor